MTLAPAAASRQALTAPPKPLPMMRTSQSAATGLTDRRRTGKLPAIHVPQLAHEQHAETRQRLEAGRRRRALRAERGELLEKVEQAEPDDAAADDHGGVLPAGGHFTLVDGRDERRGRGPHVGV